MPSLVRFRPFAQPPEILRDRILIAVGHAQGITGADLSRLLVVYFAAYL